MICNSCGQKNAEGVSFCTNCGVSISTDSPKLSHLNLTKTQKTIVLSLLSVIIVMLGLILFLPSGNGTRTIMIYIVGSNLETDAGIVTKDIDAIDPSKIDLKKVNVLLYTGGTEKWHNFISNDDNGIYILKSNGFEKIKSEQQYNLGNPDTLSNFLKYGYNNYKADKYNLIMYNHGGAIDGAIYDDISGDNLTLEDMEIALNNSPFNKNNKLDAVLFRTCLNGTIELANLFYPYANYLIGSEEVSYGSGYTSVLNFINDLDANDSGKEFGIKFVEAYEQQISKMFLFDDLIYTYSVIDLSKIQKVNNFLDTYISNIDLSKNYNTIAKIRANLYQFGIEVPSYDMVDLYEFIDTSKEYSTEDSSKLLNAIKECVIYNKSNNDSSHGLSVYFPYSGKKGMQNKFLDVYEKLNYSEEYKKFIKTFNIMKSSPSSFNFNVKNNDIKKEDTTKSVSLQLTKEQIDNYAYSTFAIFEQDMEHPNYYWVLLSSDNVELSSDGLLTANYENSFIKLFDKDDNKDYYLNVFYRQKYGRKVTAILHDKKENLSEKLQTESDPIVDLYITNDNKGNPIVATAKVRSDNEYLDGIILDVDNYNTYNIIRSRKKILDNNGNVLDTSEWESPPVFNILYGKNEELKTALKYTSLDKGDNYYALFIVTDINGQISYSKLIKVGE